MRLPGVLLAALALRLPPEGCRGENVAILGDGPPPAADAEPEDGEPDRHPDAHVAERKRVKISGLDVLDLNLHSFFGLGNGEDVDMGNNDGSLNYDELHIENSLFDAIQADPSCKSSEAGEDDDCFSPPASTVEEVVEESDVQSQCGTDVHASLSVEVPDDVGDKTEDDNPQCEPVQKKKFVDKHWGSDINVLKMRDVLRGRRGKYWDSPEEPTNSTFLKRPPRPPVILLPGLASTRLTAWKHKSCSNALLSDIKMLDNVWLNMNLLIQMATIDSRCWSECLTLAKHQLDFDGTEEEFENSTHCKLRPGDGLDAISSLAPGSVSSNLALGSTNTVYAWLIQWLADNLGYDVSSIVGLPYDWRLSPDKLEERDGFLTLMKKRIEAAVHSNGLPSIMVAHSMGNLVFRYFLEWLRSQLREEAYSRYVQNAERAENHDESFIHRSPFWIRRAFAGNEEGHANTNEFEYIEAGAKSQRKYPKLWELAKAEGDGDWIAWQGKHIWTYIGLAAPLLGAAGPLRSVLSGENMGLPFSHEEARVLELSFGSTLTANPISTKVAFCDGEGSKASDSDRHLACLEEIIQDIERSDKGDPWQNLTALRLLLRERVDYGSAFPPVRVEVDRCESENEKNKKISCQNITSTDFDARHLMDGSILKAFSNTWREENDPLGEKFDQLKESWWESKVPNMLESTPERPHIKHVIMAYGVDVSTETGYIYRKTENRAGNSSTPQEYDGIPHLAEVIWEERGGCLFKESTTKFVKESLLGKKRLRRNPLGAKNETQWLHRSGDGTINYISLMWAHTWLLHATRAMMSNGVSKDMIEGERLGDPRNALERITVSHRPKGGSEWIDGIGREVLDDENESVAEDEDTGTNHPHGTKYKPRMLRFESSGKSRSTGMTYTTTVIEAESVEHKETTRNYDILSAAFTDVLKNLHEDYGII